MAVHSDLLKILACPRCKASLTLTDDNEGLSCAKCRVVYPIREDIPVMLIEEAVPAEEWEKGERAVTK